MTSNRLTQIVTLPWSWQKSTNLVKCWSSKIQPSNNLGHQRMLPKKCLVLFYLYFHPFNRAHICILRQAVKCLSNFSEDFLKHRAGACKKSDALILGLGRARLGLKALLLGVF